MIKVYQQFVDNKKGDCMQAVIASLFEKTMDEVPKFIETDSWFESLYNYINENGYKYCGMLHNKYYSQLWQTKADCFKEPKYHRRSIMSPKRLYREKGVNGLFYAGILSPKYFSWGAREDVTHAVVIDRDYNIVHDPNPEYQNLYMYPLANLLRYNGVIDVYLINPK
jgi:hypothetical protein